MVMNPLGAQVVADGGTPRIITFTARETISGGMMVFASGANNVVGSQTASFASSDLLCAQNASGNQFNGIALQTAGSNSILPVQTRGIFLLTASNTVTAGYKVVTDGSHSVANAGSVAGNVAGIRPIGRALTNAASGGYCVIDIQS